MYKLIQRNKKLLLAIFGVILMIAFIVPAGMNQGGPDTESFVVGRFGDEKLTRGEVVLAYRDLEGLLQARFSPLHQLGESMFGRGEGQIATQLREKPETYALLQREARAAGVVVDEEMVSALFDIYFRQRATTPDQVAGYRGAIERFLLVRNHYQQLLANVKITQPLVRDSIVGSQQPTLNVVEFKAADFLAEVPAPTEKQIVAHYNQYATVMPEPPSAFGTTQPVQFGYRQQDKLKLQYLELPGDQLLEAAIKGLSAVDLLPLQRVAFSYYSANPSEFQTTPATQPGTAPATRLSPIGPTTEPATQPATGPTTRPFAEVRPDIQRKVLRGDIDPKTAPPEDRMAAMMLRQRVEARAAELRDALRERLVKDYEAARRSVKAGGEDKSPQSLGKIEAVEYLEGVANDFEKEHGVRPIVQSLASDWLTVSDLSALPGIGEASADGLKFRQLATRHADDIKPAGPDAPKTQPATDAAAGSTTQPSTRDAATRDAAATRPADTQPADTQPATAATMPAAQIVEATTPAKPALGLYEPSPLLVGNNESAYIFRLTEFDGAHVPTLDEVRDAIVKDLKLVQAYDLARKEANTLREAAGSSLNSAIGGLPVNSTSVIEVGPVRTNGQQPEIPGYDVSDPEVQQRFLLGLSMLKDKAKADQPHPSTVIELPAQQKVLAMELRSFQRPWTADEDAQMQLRAITTARMALMQEPGIQEALQEWFNSEAVATRMNYKASEE